MPVVLLKDGASQTKGREAQKNNIAAAKIIAEIVHTSLGPRGMDKMLVDSLGDVTITNDGATILKEIDVQHPAAKMLVEISKSTDNEVGDGTTSAVVLAGALLEQAESLLLQDVHPTVIVDGYRKAATKAKQCLKDIADQVTANEKSILLKNEPTENKIKSQKKEGKKAKKGEPKDKEKESKKKLFDKDLSKTYISLEEINELGTFKKIENVPDDMFKSAHKSFKSKAKNSSSIASLI